MPRTVWLVAVLLLVAPPGHAGEPAKPLLSGQQNPTSVAVGPDGRVFIAVAGEFDKDGDGAIFVLNKGKAIPFASDLDDPRGIAAFQQSLFVADRQRIWRI